MLTIWNKFDLWPWEYKFKVKVDKKSILYSKFSKFKMEWNGYSENTGKWTIRENKPQMYNLDY